MKIICVFFIISFLIKSTGIIEAASKITIPHPAIPKGTQLNIFPIHWNGGNGINAQLTIAA